MHRIDHPQYHPIAFKKTPPRPYWLRSSAPAEPKQEWRGGAKVRKP